MGGAGGGAAAAMPLLGLFGLIGAVIGTRVHQRSQRKASGLPLSPYMLLAVTAERVHLLRAGHGWRAKDVIAVWPRQGVQALGERKVLTERVKLFVPAEARRVDLEAVRGRPIREVLGMLAPVGAAPGW